MLAKIGELQLAMNSGTQLKECENLVSDLMLLAKSDKITDIVKMD
jgi:hypothetical protein